MIWTFCSAFIVVLYPLWESRAALVQISTGIVKVHGSPYPSAAVIVPLNLFCFVMCRTSFHPEAESSRVI
jgi:hypothetical protein